MRVSQVTAERLHEAAREMGEQAYFHVSHTQLSIARYYGGITVNSVYYWYLPHLDALATDKTIKRALRNAKLEKRLEMEEIEPQLELTLNTLTQ